MLPSGAALGYAPEGTRKVPPRTTQHSGFIRVSKVGKGTGIPHWKSMAALRD